MTDLELQEFYEDFVRRLRSQGVLCAITSGLACVHYGIAETTKDCDLLCHMASFDVLLELLENTPVDGRPPQYRGDISPPLDARWHRGGWTSHFEWEAGREKVTLDVFGTALRESSRWEDEPQGLYAGLQVVAEMKRTDRPKDWPFVNALGEQLLDRRDPRGWLHLYDADTIVELAKECSIPEAMVLRRPLLQLAAADPETLRFALQAESAFWQELDRVRIRILRAALRPFVLAVRRARRDGDVSLKEQHAIRLKVAEEHLNPRPIASYGLDRYIEEARRNTAKAANPDLMKWLPDVSGYFRRYVE